MIPYHFQFNGRVCGLGRGYGRSCYACELGRFIPTVMWGGISGFGRRGMNQLQDVFRYRSELQFERVSYLVDYGEGHHTERYNASFSFVREAW